MQPRIKIYPSCNYVYPAATLRGTHGNVPCTPETTDMHSLPSNCTCPTDGTFPTSGERARTHHEQPRAYFPLDLLGVVRTMGLQTCTMTRV